ncbi:MAG: hypothetical protein APF84_04270 [Gracilibacter sp. BRH_c7a]|nr:MAG: hypothetical protein APF84_04270 [Gracilibacter sp. BRH_c7a]
MISRAELESLRIVGKIIIEYPNTGQKKVFLTEHFDGTIVIAKIVKSGDERVKREIEIVTENSIPNVPQIIELKEFTNISGENFLCIIEEYIEGDSLQERLSKTKLNLNEGIKLLRTLLEISLVLEKINIVHRDIKPSNIMCCRNTKFYLIDFGIARVLDKASLTMTEARIGPHTPGYGAPELFQYSKKNIDIRSDLFSIGVVLFEALTGEHPFLSGDELSMDEIWYKTKTITPKEYQIDGDTSKQLISFIQTLMQKHTTRRPPSAQKAFDWFEAVLSTLEMKGD